MALQPNDSVGPYVLIRQLGQGAFGEVWLARHQHLGEERAIKVPTDAGYVRQLRTEAKIQFRLNHPNIVRTVDFMPDHEPPYYVMEYVVGVNLRQRLQTPGKLPLAEAHPIVRQILLALEHAHAAGVCHRDLKPENILCGAAGVVKVTDFGFGKIRPVDAQSMIFSGSLANAGGGNITGTVQYMSPQQQAGEDADPRDDLYSLGVIACELLTGLRPQPVGVTKMLARAGADVAFATVLEKAMEQDWKDRYADAAEMRNAFDDAVRRTTTTNKRVQQIARPAKSCEDEAPATRAIPANAKHGDDTATIVCLHCDMSQEVGRKAMTSICKFCGKSLRLEDLRFKEYQARRVIETCGIITVEKEATVIVDRVHCGGLIVRGKIRGAILSRGPVLVGPEAEITGDLTAPILAMGEGAVVKGNWDIGAGNWEIGAARASASLSPLLPDTSSSVTVIAGDMLFRGVMSCRGAIIRGRSEGKINSSGHILIAQSANIGADIEADSVTLAGEMEGNIACADFVEMEATTRYKGNLTAATLSVERGADVVAQVGVGSQSGRSKESKLRLAPSAETAAALARLDAHNMFFISPDGSVKGEIAFEKHLRIAGKFEGKINTPGFVELAKESKCGADICAGSVSVDGELEGNLSCTDFATFGSAARYKGDMSVRFLMVAPGAALVGHFRVGPVGEGAPPAQVATALPADPDPSFIAAGSILEGEILCGALQIGGRFEGQISCKGRVEIQSLGQCRADIYVHSAILAGKHEGNIVSQGRVQIRSTGHYRGDMIATNVSVEEGASLRGSVDIGPTAVAEYAKAKSVKQGGKV